ncbi:MAG: hypothetical protein ACFFC3_13930 [Candidatus Odinarchaeota archaeon]
MTALSDEIKEIRREFAQQIFDRIKEEAYTMGVYHSTVHSLASLWLHKIAKEEGLLNREEYDNPEAHDFLLKRIKEFLVKYVK